MRLSNVSLRQLEYFLAVADAGSIALAAANLHVSQSAVAATLTSLERALDVQLCVRRRSHGISLTASGRLLRDRARELLLETTTLEQAVSGTARPLTGGVLIGCPDEMAPTILPPILEALRREHPAVEPTIEIGLEESFWPRIATGEVDLAIALDHRLPADLTSLALRPMPVSVILPAGHPLAARDEIELSDLADEDWIMLDTEPGATHAMSMFNRARLRPRIAFRSPSFELARSLVGRGLGYTIHIHRPHGDTSQEGRPLAVRPLVTNLPVEHVTVAWSARIRPSPLIRAVLAAARTAWNVP